MRTIAMQTYRLRHHVRPFAADATHPVVLHHFEGLRQGLLFAVNQRARLGARHQAAVGQITAIGKHLLTRRQTIALPSADQFAARQTHQHQLRVNIADRAGDRVGQRRRFGRLVVEHAVRLYVLQLAALSLNDRRQSANLIQRLGIDRFRRQIHRRAAKIFPVGISRMGAHCHAVLQCLAHALHHQPGVAGVKPTGDIRRRHQLEQRAIVRPAFPEIGIEINHHRGVSTPVVQDNADDRPAPSAPPPASRPRNGSAAPVGSAPAGTYRHR